MNEISISIRGGRTRFNPGEVIEGSVNWNLGAPPKSMEIRLFWQTRGKGTTDASVVQINKVENPVAMGDAPYRFALPEAPHSFEGQLIALVWAIEVIAKPARGKELSESLEFELSPFAQPIVLPKIDKPLSPLEEKFKSRDSLCRYTCLVVYCTTTGYQDFRAFTRVFRLRQ
ncbi:hypothetical protein EON80_23690 [bacterium]|nr:MAG: hypothetical protein EON80_23690 [bacterium]